MKINYEISLVDILLMTIVYILIIGYMYHDIKIWQVTKRAEAVDTKISLMIEHEERIVTVLEQIVSKVYDDKK